MKTVPVAICELKLENFEGPFDLLIHLIEKNEMNLYDIKIAEITEQYLDYLLKMEQLDMDIASEFLVTAATLLHIKSRMLLPTIVDDDEPLDPREELILQLIEYKRCKASAANLKESHIKSAYYFYRDSSGENFGKTERTYLLSSGMLREMFSLVNKRNYNKQNKKARYVASILRHEKYTVNKKIRELVKILYKEHNISFFEKFKKANTNKLDLIVGFLSILELAKEKKARLKQTGIFKDIRITKTDRLKKNDFDSYMDIYY